MARLTDEQVGRLPWWISSLNEELAEMPELGRSERLMQRLIVELVRAFDQAATVNEVRIQNGLLLQQAEQHNSQRMRLLKRLDAQEGLVDVAEVLVIALESIASGDAAVALAAWREAIDETVDRS